MKPRLSVVMLIIVLAVFVGACAGGGPEDDAIAAGVAATQTKQAWEADLESIRQTEQAQGPELAQETVETMIVHEMIPGEPAEKSNTYVTDFNSIDFAEEGITYSDQFFINRYERPFTVEMEQYKVYLDLILTNLKVNPPWIYAVIYLAGELPETNQALYSLEVDNDEDGRGDFLIQAPLPPDDQWTVEGVVVLEDQDDDVGGPNPVFTDPPGEGISTNGFETELFRSGVGEDPDLAWVRRDPVDPTSLQIAFKVDLVGAQGFFWSVWADEGLRNPGFADYNDKFNFEEAGSPYPEHDYYPIQEINLVDSTCRSWYGLEPVGDEPGICQVYSRGTGYKLCLTYNLGNTTLTNCSDVCMEECPRLPDPIGGLSWSCQKCTMPEE